jgi:hypothetical protein
MAQTVSRFYAAVNANVECSKLTLRKLIQHLFQFLTAADNV